MTDIPLVVVGWIALAFFVGATAKGALGFGMPSIAVPLIASLVDVKAALALMCMPIIASNLWQAFHGGYLLKTLSRFRWIFITVGGGCVFGAYLLASLDSGLIFAVVGTIIVIYVSANLMAPSFRIPAERERAVGLVVGSLAGVIGGMSTLFGPPLIMYFTALHLAKDHFIASLGGVLLFASFLTVISYLAMDILTQRLLLLSALCLLPMLAGLLFGQVIRNWINPALFRRGVLILLFFAGLNLIRRGVM